MGRRVGASKDVEKLVRIAERQGWDVRLTGGNHLRFKSPDGPVIFGGLTACGPGQKKLAAELKKAGLAV